MPQYNATPPSLITGSQSDLNIDQRGNLRVTLFPENSSGTIINATDTDGLFLGNGAINTKGYMVVHNGASWDRFGKPNAVSRLASSAATNNATSAKASAGSLFTLNGVNTNAAARYLKFYNKASAPNPAADTIFWALYLPPSTVDGGRFSFSFGSLPLYFSTGIAWALVTGSGDTDNTAVGAGDILQLNISYS